MFAVTSKSSHRFQTQRGDHAHQSGISRKGHLEPLVPCKKHPIAVMQEVSHCSSVHRTPGTHLLWPSASGMRLRVLHQWQKCPMGLQPSLELQVPTGGGGLMKVPVKGNHLKAGGSKPAS